MFYNFPSSLLIRANKPLYMMKGLRIFMIRKEKKEKLDLNEDLNQIIKDNNEQLKQVIKKGTSPGEEETLVKETVQNIKDLFLTHLFYNFIHPLKKSKDKE